MKMEIDQSIKIEDSGDTYLAFSNGTSYSICIPFAVKQRGLQALRERGKSRKQSMLLLFAACLFLLVKDHITRIDLLIIDNEYDGHQDDIRSFLYEYLRRMNLSIQIETIIIAEITKKSRAHRVVWSVYRKITPYNKLIGERELLAVIARKKDRRAPFKSGV